MKTLYILLIILWHLNVLVAGYGWASSEGMKFRARVFHFLTDIILGGIAILIMILYDFFKDTRIRKTGIFFGQTNIFWVRYLPIKGTDQTCDLETDKELASSYHRKRFLGLRIFIKKR